MIGNMRHLLTIEHRVRVADDSGGFSESWQSLPQDAQVWAAIETLSGRQILRAGQLQPAATHRLHLHYRQGLSPGMRLTGEGVCYDITAVLDRDNRKQYLEVMATSGT